MEEKVAEISKEKQLIGYLGEEKTQWTAVIMNKYLKEGRSGDKAELFWSQGLR